MVNYKVTVSTADHDNAGTKNSVYIKLVGTDGESKRTSLKRIKGASFIKGAVSSFTVPCPVSIGKLVLIELDKQHGLLSKKDSWFPAKVEVESPDGNAYIFPIYCWITDNKVHSFREGTALRVFEDNHHHGRNSREQELKQREKEYCWHEYAEGIPHCIKAENFFSLPSHFSITKDIELGFTVVAGEIQLKLEGLTGSTENWTDIDAVHRVFPCRHTVISEYVSKHWKEDSFFSYQFLNGVNPMLIRRCTALPDNFPVTDNMVFPNGQSGLAEEMKKGNIFLCDYKCLDGLKANTISGKKQFLTAPLILLHLTPDDKLMPIAIQLKQTPAVDNPIFLPTDSEYDWLMAKIFVRSADFSVHQLDFHLLRTHMMAEVFAVSLLRNMPMMHPLYKLLVPHTRDTLEINYLARHRLISNDGAFTKFAGCGGDGLFTLLRRSLSSMTYSSLCIPDDIAERGLEAVPYFYYRDDGLKLWNIIHRFVQGMVSFYYKNDAEVQKDYELQKWISDIFEHGFLAHTSTGIPQSFTTVAELAKFVTMVIFTCSGQHSAVNTGQYDYGGWMPNTPIALQLPPPTTKGTTSEATMLQTLPNKFTTAKGMAVMWLLSRQSSDLVPLGQFPRVHFSEEIPCELIKVFQAELKLLSLVIKTRNKSLAVPYTYLDPEAVENSVAI